MNTTVLNIQGYQIKQIAENIYSGYNPNNLIHLYIEKKKVIKAPVILQQQQFSGSSSSAQFGSSEPSNLPQWVDCFEIEASKFEEQILCSVMQDSLENGISQLSQKLKA